ncbi:DUF3969 family protein [Pseudomonas sp. St316]|uniref:DUF3969 family protein n=1 Tax=Pseudomonas sp. St316 TaxID=2678257 RepID=UPI001BB3A129|nr:DUF3969 family protein [Pseudomonas sp. St316]BBP61605.1 hypothetical protein PHLH4_51950 [Pseudomonas sp. St316]
MKDMSLMLEVFEVEEAARFISALSIGLLVSVQRGAMTLEEAERLIFSPRSSRVLKEKGISPEIFELIMNCCELEDVLDLAPSKFDSNVQILLDKFLGFLKTSKSRDTDLNFVELK